MNKFDKLIFWKSDFKVSFRTKDVVKDESRRRRETWYWLHKGAEELLQLLRPTRSASRRTVKPEGITLGDHRSEGARLPKLNWMREVMNTKVWKWIRYDGIVISFLLNSLKLQIHSLVGGITIPWNCKSMINDYFTLLILIVIQMHFSLYSLLTFQFSIIILVVYPTM